jgi:hypothetical protein
LPLFGKEAPEELAAPLGLESAAVGKRRTETGIGGEIEHRTAGPSAFVRRAPDHELEAGFPTGRRAHRTGLESHVKGAVLEAPIADDPPCGAEGYELGVGRWVGICLPLIPGACDDLTIPGDDRTDRYLTAQSGSLGIGQSFGHEATVVVVENPVG